MIKSSKKKDAAIVVAAVAVGASSTSSQVESAVVAVAVINCLLNAMTSGSQAEYTSLLVVFVKAANTDNSCCG